MGVAIWQSPFLCIKAVEEKYTKGYTNRFKCFLFMGTNKPVKITDSKSGLLRRLIDVNPSGNKLGRNEYRRCMKQVEFELGAIAKHCLDVYMSDPGYYDDYVPTSMMEATNDFFNFMIDSYRVFKKEDGTTLKAAWEMYKVYTDEAKVPFPMSKRNFKEELKKADGRLILLIEEPEIETLEDIWWWDNPRLKINPRAIKGTALYKSLCTIRDEYRVDIRFCNRKDTGKEIIKILGGEL